MGIVIFVLYYYLIKTNVSCETIKSKALFVLHFCLINNVSCETLINAAKIYCLIVFAINGLFELFEGNNIFNIKKIVLKTIYIAISDCFKYKWLKR